MNRAPPLGRRAGRLTSREQAAYPNPTAIVQDARMTEPREPHPVAPVAIVSLPRRRSQILIGVLLVSLAGNVALLVRLISRRAAEPSAAGEIQYDGRGRRMAQFHVDPETGVVSQSDYFAPDGRITARWFDRDLDGRWELGEASCGRVVTRCEDKDGDGCCERLIGLLGEQELWTADDTDRDGMIDIARRGTTVVRDVDQDGFFDFDE
jgi:hypothetical protein